MLRATVSGSFRRHLAPISFAVQELRELGVEVLSPADPRVVDAVGEFVFVASDAVRSVRLVQDRHLESIGCSDFLWLVAPDGYVGQSASLELGFAIGRGIPIFSSADVNDLTLRQYVRKSGSLPGLVQALRTAAASAPRTYEPRANPFLVNPSESLEHAHALLSKMQDDLNRPPAAINDTRAVNLYTERDELLAIFDSGRKVSGSRR